MELNSLISLVEAMHSLDKAGADALASGALRNAASASVTERVVALAEELRESGVRITIEDGRSAVARAKSSRGEAPTNLELYQRLTDAGVNKASASQASVLACYLAKCPAWESLCKSDKGMWLGLPRALRAVAEKANGSDPREDSARRILAAAAALAKDVRTGNFPAISMAEQDILLAFAASINPDA